MIYHQPRPTVFTALKVLKYIEDVEDGFHCLLQSELLHR